MSVSYVPKKCLLAFFQFCPSVLFSPRQLAKKMSILPVIFRRQKNFQGGKLEKGEEGEKKAKISSADTRFPTFFFSQKKEEEKKKKI